MKNTFTESPIAGSRGTAAFSRAAALLIICGLGVGGVAAEAATRADDVPRLVVKFDAASLATDAGARTLYRRLVKAADQVCPATAVDRPFLRTALLECRQQALARAVHDINSPHLAAVYAAVAKRG